MAHGFLKTLLGLHPGSVRKKAARAKRARAVRPSRAVELWYRYELRRIVEQCRRAGEDIAAGMRAHWPAVHDEAAPGLEVLLRQAAARFGNIEAVAERLARLAAQKSLAAVDERLAKAILQAVGIDIRSYLDPNAKIGAAMHKAAAANVELIKSIPAQYLDRVQATVEQAFAKGKRWEAMVSDIKEAGDITDRRARLIARDQVSKMNASFNQVRQTDLGIKRYTWSTAHDERVRRSHGALDGTIQEWGKPPVVDGEAANPGEPVNCRCAALPVIDLAEEPADGGTTAIPEAA